MMQRKTAKTRPKVRSELFFTLPSASCSWNPRSVTLSFLLATSLGVVPRGHRRGLPSSTHVPAAVLAVRASLLRYRDLPQYDLGDPFGDDETPFSFQMGRPRGEDISGLILEYRRQIKRFDPLGP